MKQTMTRRAGKESEARKMARDLLLACGFLSSLLWVGTDIAAAMRWEGYSYTNQAISELSAIDAPTRAFMVPLLVVYDVLLIAFGIGLLGAAGANSALRVTAWIILADAALGLVWMFFPMHMRGAVNHMTMTDTMHVVIAGVAVPLMLLYVGFGAAARGKWFRLYSIGTLLLVIVFGAWTGYEGTRLAAQLPTPYLGTVERISSYLIMLWVAVLTVDLLRAEKAQGPRFRGGA